MRMLITSDWHGDSFTAGLARFDDVARSARATVDLARRERCDGYVFLGDLSDPGPRAHRCSALAIELDHELDRAGIWRRWLVGNHDVVEDGTGSSTMSSLASHCRGFRNEMARVWSDPLWEHPGRVAESGVFVVALPHPARGRAYEPAEYVRGCDLPDEHARTVFVFGHLTVPGIEPGSEVLDMPRGREVRYPVEAIRERWGDRALMFNGHYHRSYRRSESPVVVPGSLERLTRGEAGNAPGCLIVEV